MFAGFESRYEIESCAESGPWQLGRLSAKDGAACGRHDLDFSGSAGQRRECKCPTGKTELLSGPLSPCGHGCLYCYWRDPAK